MWGFDKSYKLSVLGEAFLNKVYLTTYFCIILFIVLSIILYKTKFGLRLRSCGENPQASASLGINVFRMRYAGVMISGALAGLGGCVLQSRRQTAQQTETWPVSASWLWLL